MPVTPIAPSGVELNRHLYRAMGPNEETATPLEKGQWRKWVLPAIVRLIRDRRSNEELRRLLEQADPGLDLNHHPLPEEELLRPEGRDRSWDRPIGRRIPTPTTRPVEWTEPLVRTIAALILLTGRVDYPDWAQVRGRAPLRLLGELLGVSHQAVSDLILSRGEPTQAIVRRDPTRPERGLRGINESTGGRRGAPAYRPTLYQFQCHPRALEIARAHVAEHGYPDLTWAADAGMVDQIEVTFKEHMDAKREWHRIVEALSGLGIKAERINLLLGVLNPEALKVLDGKKILFVSGWWYYRAIDLVQLVSDVELCVILGPPKPLRR